MNLDLNPCTNNLYLRDPKNGANSTNMEQFWFGKAYDMYI